MLLDIHLQYFINKSILVQNMKHRLIFLITYISVGTGTAL
jgi:hypothetical protein